MPTRLHPLVKPLGPDWQWLTDDQRAVVVLLHGSGLWTVIPRRLLWDPTMARTWPAVARALVGCVWACWTGQVVVTVAHAPDGSASAEAELQGDLDAWTCTGGGLRCTPADQGRRGPADGECSSCAAVATTRPAEDRIP